MMKINLVLLVKLDYDETVHEIDPNSWFISTFNLNRHHHAQQK